MDFLYLPDIDKKEKNSYVQHLIEIFFSTPQYIKVHFI